ncbi:diacylglycerol/lipid kinase family protein, partial [Streptomyces sp. NPDC057757]|uniref:diacylglycerol/lipid kinase family protein n=1 Tax=Streptomyces sp. NPDC057757 TaxID=3346241 RepID=UPI0036BBAC8D
GMHHPTDLVGGLVNGSLSLLIVGRALFTEGTVAAAPSARPAPGAGPGASAPRVPAPGRTVVVVNPTVTDENTCAELRDVLRQHGYSTVEFVETTAGDPGGGQAARAVRDGASLVVVCGGDGTLRAAADAMAASDVPLALVPSGTGNLLARNLNLPLSPAAALDAALGGSVHHIDLGRIEGDGVEATHFAAMSGAGLDAAIMENTDDRTKSFLGWPAYILAGITTLRSPRMRLTIQLDGAPALRRTARMVLLANVGTVQGGLTLVPAARCDDGQLDLLVLDPHGPGGWIRALGTLLRGGARTTRPTSVETLTVHDADSGVPVEYFTFRHAELTFESEQSRELDGDPVAPGRRLTAEVRPGALTMLLPPREK